MSQVNFLLCVQSPINQQLVGLLATGAENSWQLLCNWSLAHCLQTIYCYNCGLADSSDQLFLQIPVARLLVTILTCLKQFLQTYKLFNEVVKKAIRLHESIQLSKQVHAIKYILCITSRRCSFYLLQIYPVNSFFELWWQNFTLSLCC